MSIFHRHLTFYSLKDDQLIIWLIDLQPYWPSFSLWLLRDCSKMSLNPSWLYIRKKCWIISDLWSWHSIELHFGNWFVKQKTAMCDTDFIRGWNPPQITTLTHYHLFNVWKKTNAKKKKHLPTSTEKPSSVDAAGKPAACPGALFNTIGSTHE